MFEAVCLGRTLSKSEFEQQETILRESLLDAQFRLRDRNRAILILLAGVDGACKSDLINRLNKWMDTRSIQVHAFWDRSDEEIDRPFYWRFWRVMPARRTIGIFFTGWYWQLLHDRINGRISRDAFDAACNLIKDTECMLADDGMIIIKLWLHIERHEQKKRLKEMQQAHHDSPVPLRDDKIYKKYDDYIAAAQRAIRLTDNLQCKWHLIEATDAHYRDITAGQVVLDAMQQALNTQAVQRNTVGNQNSALTVPSEKTVLDEINLATKSDKKHYKHQLDQYQRRLNDLAWQCYAKKRSVVLVFEGWDAAGKGGVIRRITAAMDARLYRVISVSAPSDEELSRHYLWRFWRQIPRAGHFTLYDRSWYGRVLVERVEQLASEQEWGRAYHEINNFEAQLTQGGIILMKFWLHIDRDEQLARFRARENTPWKHYKITEDDWRNRNKWDDYKTAVQEMVAHTSTDQSPWQLIAANDKHAARAEIIRRVCDRIESELA